MESSIHVTQSPTPPPSPAPSATSSEREDAAKLPLSNNNTTASEQDADDTGDPPAAEPLKKSSSSTPCCSCSLSRWFCRPRLAIQDKRAIQNGDDCPAPIVRPPKSLGSPALLHTSQSAPVIDGTESSSKPPSTIPSPAGSHQLQSASSQIKLVDNSLGNENQRAARFVEEIDACDESEWPVATEEDALFTISGDTDEEDSITTSRVSHIVTR